MHESLDLDKYQTPMDPPIIGEEELQLAIVDMPTSGWTKVKSKRRKKGQIEDDLNT